MVLFRLHPGGFFVTKHKIKLKKRNQMKLYNSMSRQIETIKPFKKGKIGLYACGFTVYDYTHLGHLRKYTMDDVLIRVLRHAGFEVTFVQNVTDVGHLTSDADTGEDKLEKGAKKYGQSVWDIAKKFEDYFFYSMDAMGNLRPDVSCRATDHIKEQLQMVVDLEDKGYTYEIPGDGIYFDTSKFKDYGKLAHLQLDKQKEGARVATEGKRNPSDFALWKFERKGEHRAMAWPSPWAERSFPGWHIECSAMAIHYLGDQFDIHTGGIDHIPVHHTNEIAQAEAATGKSPFVKYWVHHNFVRVDDEKMSKSLGNFLTIDDVLEKGYHSMALRLLFLGTHYRSQMNFTWESLDAAQKAWERLSAEILKLKEIAGKEHERDSVQIQGYIKRFFSFVENDLEIPEAVALMWNLIKDKNIPAKEKLDALYEFDQVLGLGLQKIKVPAKEKMAVPEEVQKLLDKRQQARQAKDWAKSDELRKQINQLGFQVEDTTTGQKLSSN